MADMCSSFSFFVCIHIYLFIYLLIFALFAAKISLWYEQWKLNILELNQFFNTEFSQLLNLNCVHCRTLKSHM